MAQTKKTRVPIPKATSAKVLFFSDRTCCVCRVKGKPVQIHHLDEDPGNNDTKNLAVLCLECHDLTQLTGGFGRKLDLDQVTLYRDDWHARVARERAFSISHAGSDAEEAILDGSEPAISASIIEVYRDAEDYESLAMHYLGIGNADLRDKYIEKAIERGVDDDAYIFFRSEQGRLDLLPKEVIDRELKRLETTGNWTGVGRLYRRLGDNVAAATATCKGVLKSLEGQNVFTAAYYIKEMVEDGVIDELFEMAFEQAASRNDLWWQYRALTELGWSEEVKGFLIDNRQAIAASGNPRLQAELAVALGNKDEYAHFRIAEAMADIVAQEDISDEVTEEEQGGGV